MVQGRRAGVAVVDSTARACVSTQRLTHWLAWGVDQHTQVHRGWPWNALQRIDPLMLSCCQIELPQSLTADYDDSHAKTRPRALLQHLLRLHCC